MVTHFLNYSMTFFLGSSVEVSYKGAGRKVDLRNGAHITFGGSITVADILTFVSMRERGDGLLDRFMFVSMMSKYHRTFKQLDATLFVKNLGVSIDFAKGALAVFNKLRESNEIIFKDDVPAMEMVERIQNSVVDNLNAKYVFNICMH